MQLFLHLSVLKNHFTTQHPSDAPGDLALPPPTEHLQTPVRIALLLISVSSTKLECVGDFVEVQEIVVNLWPLKLGSLSSNASCPILLL